MLVIKNLKSAISGKEILKGVSLTIKPGEVHAVMGPNGAGKTSLVMPLMGHPSYIVSSDSKITIDKEEIQNLPVEERAKKGLFVAFQQPIDVTGVSTIAFLRTARRALHPETKKPLAQFKKEAIEALEKVHLSEEFLKRSINEGFSGGEKKRSEIAQLLVLEPKYAILDEIDSGLDVDSLRYVSQAVSDFAKEKNVGILLITHYQRILHYLKPDMVHVLVDGKIVTSGGMEIVEKIESEGYAKL